MDLTGCKAKIFFQDDLGQKKYAVVEILEDGTDYFWTRTDRGEYYQRKDRITRIEVISRPESGKQIKLNEGIHESN